MAWASLKVDQDAAAELRVAKAELSRARGEVTSISDTLRALVSAWRAAQAGQRQA